MRELSVFLCVFVSLCFGASAQAEQFICAEKASEAVQLGRRQYAVRVVRLMRLRDPKIVGDYDGAEVVDVSIISRDPVKGTAFRKDRQFNSVAKFADVSYLIESKKNGFLFSLYLDELDQTTMKLAEVRGDIFMTCVRKNSRH